MAYQKKADLLPEVPCSMCLKMFKRSQPRQRLCTRKCSDDFYVRRSALSIPRQSTGAISEMAVCADLLKKGYAVFRAVSSSCFCDVMAVKGDENLRLEVRTGYKALDGHLTFPKKIYTKIATPTHYAVYIPQTNEVFTIEITADQKSKFEKKKQNRSSPSES